MGKYDKDIFLGNCRHGVAMLMSVFVQNVVDMIVDYELEPAFNVRVKFWRHLELFSQQTHLYKM